MLGTCTHALPLIIEFYIIKPKLSDENHIILELNLLTLVVSPVGGMSNQVYDNSIQMNGTCLSNQPCILSIHILQESDRSSAHRWTENNEMNEKSYSTLEETMG